MIDRLAERGGRPAPITIYRALDFLLAQGLVHRIESRNAFVACVHKHDSGDPIVFLLCERCGAVGEADFTCGRGRAQGRRARRRLHAENPGDRDRRRMRPLQGGVTADTPPLKSPRYVERTRVPSPHSPARSRRHGVVVVLCLTWGFNQVAVKLAESTTFRR